MEFNAILFSTVLFIPAMMLHIFLCRINHGQRAVAYMFLSFFVYFTDLTLLWFFLRPEARQSVEAWVTLYAMAGFYALGYMEFFSMLCRGFSLSILVSLYEKPGQTLHEVIASYGNGGGADGLLRKRIGSLTKIGFVKESDRGLELGSTTASSIAHLTALYKKMFRLGAGG